MASYNLTRSVKDLLQRHESSPPSFNVYLYPEHWTINNGSKFLYNNQMASILDDIRAQRIPVDFLELFDKTHVPFYEGSLIVELLDYRPPKAKEPILEKPGRTRVVLHPTAETLWGDICLLNQKYHNTWRDEDALEFEAKLLVATAPPLCLDPEPRLMRMVNKVIRVSTPSVPMSLKRKASAMESEDDETDRARRVKMAQFMSPTNHRPHGPNTRILDALQRKVSSDQQQQQQAPQPMRPQQTIPPSSSTPTPAAPRPLPISAVPATATPARLQQGQTPTSSQQSPLPRPPPTPIAPQSVPVASQTHPSSQPQPHLSVAQPPRPTSAARSPASHAVHVPIQPNPADPGRKTSSPAQPPVLPSPRPSTTVPRPQQPAHSGQYPPQYSQQPTPTYPPPVLPHPQYIQAQQGKPVQPKSSAMGSTPMMSSQSIPQQGAVPSQQPNQPQTTQAHALQYYPYAAAQQQRIQQAQQAQAQAQAQAQSQTPSRSPVHALPNGRKTPQVSQALRSPMVQNRASPAPVRNSPMVASSPLVTSRSPIPPSAPPQVQQQQQQQAQQQPQPQQPQMNMAQHPNIPYAVPQNQYAPQYRAMVAAKHPHPAIPPHMVNGAAVRSTPSPGQQGQQQQVQPQDGQQQQPPQQPQTPQMAHQNAQMMAHFYPYSQYPMNYGMQAGRAYWPVPQMAGMGRGIPSTVMNGQHQIPGLVPGTGHHPQQMTLGVGKAVPGGTQGR